MLTSLTLDSFKNHTDRSFSWGDKNILTGPNGSGKTNVLEAIYLFVNAIPPHERVFLQLVPTDSWILSLGGEFTKNHLPYHGRIGHTKGEWKVYFSSQDSVVTRARHRELVPFRAVLFTPMEMNILYLGPGLRRDFLDEAILLAFPEFAKVKREYGLALKNRNSLLKQIREWVSNRDTLDLWDSLFIERAKVYYEYRKRLIDFIQERATSVETLLEEKYTLAFRYTTKVDFENIESGMLRYLRENRERDIITGHTYIGPHLDDFQCIVSHYPAFQAPLQSEGEYLPTPSSEIPHWDWRGMSENSPSEKEGVAFAESKWRGSSEYPSNAYLSRGENKTILIGLKFILIEFIEQSSKKETILLLDDLFSELDSDHIESILSQAGNRQLFITAQNTPSFLINKGEFSFHDI